MCRYAMNLHLKTPNIPVLILLFVSLFCSSCYSIPPVFGPGLYKPVMTTGLDSDYRPKDSISSFFIDSPQVCCSVMFSNARSGTAVQARWIYERSQSQGDLNKTVYVDNRTVNQDGYLGFTLNAPPQGFDTGDYMLDLSVNGSLQISIPFSVKLDTSGTRPTINYFSAEPLQVVSGETSRLSWSTAGANLINIDPSLGAVAPEGSVDVSPAADTTYTLWAVNRAGNTSRHITLAVKPVNDDKADLIVTDLWSSGNVLSYRIKNVGKAASCATESYLYRNDSLVSSEYMAPLDPGEERGESFSKYHFSPRFSSYSASLTDGDSCYMKVCANGDSSCPESDYSNNCFTYNFGPLLSFDLLQYAGSAQWQSSTSPQTWPMYASSEAQIGAADITSGRSYTDALLLIPPASDGGWIQGTFGVPLGSPAELRPFTIPHKCKFTASVGLTQDAPAATNVTFMLGTSQQGAVTYFPPVTLYSGGEVAAYDVDLSNLAGQKVLFILRVESHGPLPMGRAAWIEPVISQQR